MEHSGILLALANFAFVTSITPGPNNFMVMASGAAFGWRGTFQHMLGIALGFSFMMGAVVLGFGAILEQFPHILVALRFVGAIWLLCLAWQLARVALTPLTKALTSEPAVEAARPLSLFQAAMFQWVNPKAWMMAVAASAAYSGVSSDPVRRALIMILTFAVAAMICNSAWVLAGKALQRLMVGGNSARIVNLIMAALVVVSAALILMG